MKMRSHPFLYFILTINMKSAYIVGLRLLRPAVSAVDRAWNGRARRALCLTGSLPQCPWCSYLCYRSSWSWQIGTHSRRDRTLHNQLCGEWLAIFMPLLPNCVCFILQFRWCYWDIQWVSEEHTSELQ